jgi:hypothetical protein
MNYLKSLIHSSKTTRGSEQIHAQPMEVSTSKFSTGHLTRVAHWNKPIGNGLMATAKVGYTMPDPINYSGTPISHIIKSTPEVQHSAHIKVGGSCK